MEKCDCLIVSCTAIVLVHEQVISKRGLGEREMGREGAAIEAAFPGKITSNRDESSFILQEKLMVANDASYSSLLATQARDYFLSPSGCQVKVSELKGKVVGLCFAANWYPSCQTFTQELARVYRELVDRGDKFEVVFVSSDEDLAAFDEFHDSMPWPAIPYSDLETRRALSRRFDVEAIPTLVILQPCGSDDVRCDGVELVRRHGAAGYPFTTERVAALEVEEKERHERQTLAKLLVETGHGRDYLLTQSSSDKVSVNSLVGKTVGLYFSAQWCLPCVNFTPKLITVYNKIKQSLAQDKHQGFEIVLVSNDHDQSSFTSYFSTMPWLALPFGDPAISNLAKYFDVQAIPSLVIVGPDGKTITKQGRKLINLHSEKAYPFTDTHLKSLQDQMDEEAKGLPRSQYHEGHQHELTLVSEGSGGGAFICCACEEQGSSWAYLCIECGYEVHPRCVKTVNRSGDGS